jgi:hypothetical protein
MTVVELLQHTRIDIVGLNYADKGRSCLAHPEGCGKEVDVGAVIKLKCTEAEFEEEVLMITKKVEYKSLTVMELRDLLKQYSIKSISGKTKDWLISKLLEVRGEPNDDSTVTEMKKWKEHTVEAYTVETGCKIGYIARHLVKIYGSSLDGIFAKIIKLRGQSEWKAERLESNRNGGSALAETVRMTFE